MSSAYPENDNTDSLTLAVPTQPDNESRDAQNTATAPLSLPEVSGISKEIQEKKVVAIPTRLDFVDMPNKEPHWKATHFGEAIIPSPIPVLPKPLALTYRNFYNHYEEHEFRKQERLVVTYPRVVIGCTFVSALLRHYFPAQEYFVGEIFPGTSTGEEFTPQPILDGIPIEGTRQWAVQSKFDSAIVVLVVIVTEQEFSKLPARTRPARLAVAANLLDSRSRVDVHGDCIARGGVVLLTSAGTFPKPTFEFYSFDSGLQQKGVVIPMALQMRTNHGLATNSISLAPKHAEQVDQTFKTIVRAASGQEAWPQVLSRSSAPMAPIPALYPPPTSTPLAPASAIPTKRKSKGGPKVTPTPKTKRTKRIESLGGSPLTLPPKLAPNLQLTHAPTTASSPTIVSIIAGPLDSSSRHPVDVRNDKTRQMEHHEISGAYIRTVKQNRTGNLIEENGKMIPNGKSKAIRVVAKLLDHTFRPPDHSRVRD